LGGEVGTINIFIFHLLIFFIFLVVRIPIEIGRNEYITTESREPNNWTMVLPIRWYCMKSKYGKMSAPPKYPSVKVVHVFSKFDRKTLEFMAEAVRDGKLLIPISQKMPLSEAAEAQAAAGKGNIGKILRVP
jgi:hypothetical protein